MSQLQNPARGRTARTETPAESQDETGKVLNSAGVWKTFFLLGQSSSPGIEWESVQQEWMDLLRLGDQTVWDLLCCVISPGISFATQSLELPCLRMRCHLGGDLRVRAGISHSLKTRDNADSSLDGPLGEAGTSTGLRGRSSGTAWCCQLPQDADGSQTGRGTQTSAFSCLNPWVLIGSPACCDFPFGG